MSSTVEVPYTNGFNEERVTQNGFKEEVVIQNGFKEEMVIQNGFQEERVTQNGFQEERVTHDPKLGRDLKWWMTTILYQIYPRSFQDSTGDGVGDLPGIITRLDHLSSLGVGAIWISPFYPSPQFDFGYDISDFCDVNPMFGTLQDFDELVKQCKQRDIHVLVDFVPGHTSHLHPWFPKSVRREDPYTDFYVWHDGVLDDKGNRVPPNNWLCCFGGTAWSWNEERGQFYYRPFLPEQPKLNFRNPHVVEEIKKVLRFWLDRGVSGFRVDAIEDVWEVEDQLLCEPLDPTANCPLDQQNSLIRKHTSMVPGGFPLIRGWRDVLDEYERKDGLNRIMFLEIYHPAPDRNVYRQYGGVPFNMNLVDRLWWSGLAGHTVRRLVQEEYDHLPPGEWPTFVIGNHDRHRVSRKYGRQYCDVMNMLLLTLKGTPTSYYGEELGMLEVDISYQDTQDPWGRRMGEDRFRKFSRDPNRTPMQWDCSTNAGFTSGKPWLPVHEDSVHNNVKSQKDTKELTPLKVYKSLAVLRKSPAFLYGDLIYSVSNQDLFSYFRHDDISGECFLVALNLGKNTCTTNFTSTHACAQGKQGTVAVCTSGVDKSLRVGQTVRLDLLTLHPGDGVVVQMTLRGQED